MASKQYVQAEESGSGSGSDSDSERLRGMFRRVKDEYEKLKKAYLELREKSEAESTESRAAIVRLSADLEQLRSELEATRRTQSLSVRKSEDWSKWFDQSYSPGISEISSRVASLKQDWHTTFQTTEKISDLTNAIFDWRTPGAAPRQERAQEEISDHSNFGLASREEEISRFHTMLRNRFGSVERGWFEFINPLRKKKIPSVEFFRKVRELGYPGDMRRLWTYLSSGNFVTLQGISVSSTAAARNFRSALAKVSKTGSVGDCWRLYFETETGVFTRPDFVAKLRKIFPQFSAQEAGEIFSSVAPDGLLTLEDVDQSSFVFPTGKPEISDPVRFVEDLHSRYGSLGRAWLWLFEGRTIGNFSLFARTVRAAGYTGGVKRLWLAIGGGVNLEIMDGNIFRVVSEIRTILTSKFWLHSQFDKHFVMNKDQFISRCQDLMPQFSYDQLVKAFAFFDYEDAGFVTIEDVVVRDAISDLDKSLELLPDRYQACRRRFVRAAKAVRAQRIDQLAKKGEFAAFKQFLAGILGNSIRAWIQGIGRVTETLDFWEFLGAVRGLGWTGRVKSFWIYEFGLKRDERMDIGRFTGRPDAELVRRFYESVIIKHDTVSRAWRLVINAHETGFVTKEKFARLCARGDVAEPFTENEGRTIFDALDFTASGKLHLEDLDPFGVEELQNGNANEGRQE